MEEPEESEELFGFDLRQEETPERCTVLAQDSEGQILNDERNDELVNLQLGFSDLFEGQLWVNIHYQTAQDTAAMQEDDSNDSIYAGEYMIDGRVRLNDIAFADQERGDGENRRGVTFRWVTDSVYVVPMHEDNPPVATPAASVVFIPADNIHALETLITGLQRVSEVAHGVEGMDIVPLKPLRF